jgi:hypothetical protein
VAPLPQAFCFCVKCALNVTIAAAARIAAEYFKADRDAEPGWNLRRSSLWRIN